MNSFTVPPQLYLSRLVLDARSRRAHQLLRSPDALYGELLRTVEDAAIAHHNESAAADHRGLLFRIEPQNHLSPPIVLIQTSEEPEWSQLTAEGDRLLHPQRPPETKGFSPLVAPGTELRFRLRANPSKSTPGAELSPGIRKRGRPQPLLDEVAQREWLRDKLHGAATLGEYRINDEGTQRHRREAGAPTPLLSILFEGVLRVDDGEQFARHLALGIGRGKGFGFGLLSVART